MNQQQTPKQAYAAGNFGHWKYNDRKGQWFSVPDPKQRGKIERREPELVQG